MRIKPLAATLATAGALALGSAGLVLGAAPAVATGLEGGEVTPVSHVCSGGTGAAGSNVGPGGACALVSTTDDDSSTMRKCGARDVHQHAVIVVRAAPSTRRGPCGSLAASPAP